MAKQNFSNLGKSGAAAVAGPAKKDPERAAAEPVVAASGASQGDAQADAAAAADPAVAVGARTEEPAAQPDQGEEKPYLRVSAPGGPRRRAGFRFGPEGRDLTWEDLGADDDARKASEGLLLADPELHVAFYDHEGQTGDAPAR